MTPEQEREWLGRGVPPAWASGWGQDEHGAFVCFAVGEVVQRMRWIPAGRFEMGSPETEAGRRSNEGPQHWVELTEGYWMADTPCTQALWTAVMGSNPSRFQSAQRPVERVSWDEVQQFVSALGAKVPGLDARLPTEAEWERACRAGTKTATYSGNLDLRGQRNAPVLDAIGWYGGNSGVDFDLEYGEDSSGWPEKQYEHTKAGTREVALKLPNPWGLYDMLGNVYEWCIDSPEDYADLARTDPVGTPGQSRVIRGGGWIGFARFLRAASRFWGGPGYRDGHLGFRLLRGQELRPPDQQA